MKIIHSLECQRRLYLIVFIHKKNILKHISDFKMSENELEFKDNIYLNELPLDLSWIRYSFQTCYQRSEYDLLLSPLFCLCSISSKYINDIENISSKLFNNNLLRVRDCINLFDKYAIDILDIINSSSSYENVFNKINLYLIEKGETPSNRYKLINAFYWLLKNGCLKSKFNFYFIWIYVLLAADFLLQNNGWSRGLAC